MRLDCLSPFPLDPARALPISGEHHPLRREFHRWMSLANASTMLMVAAAVCAYLGLQGPKVAPSVGQHEVKFTIPDVTTLPPPPPIEVIHETVPLPPLEKIGIPQPVEDWRVLIPDFPTVDQMKAAYDEVWKRGPGKEGDIIVAQEPSLPAPDQIVVVEVEPQFLRMNDPIYPPLAREAGIEGKVLLRVLVSKEGKVLQVIVLSGNPMLADAARLAAMSAVFSPAMQQHKPVPVWVQLPIMFSLN